MYNVDFYVIINDISFRMSFEILHITKQLNYVRLRIVQCIFLYYYEGHVIHNVV